MRVPKATASLSQWALDHCEVELHRYLARRLRAAQDARDLAQEVYLRLLRVENTEAVRNYPAYVFSVASHVVREFKLRARRDKVTYDSEVVDTLARQVAAEGSEGSSEEVNARLNVQGVLAQLPPRCQEVLVLHKQEGMTYPEVAQVLGVSTHTVHRYMLRALAALRQVKW